MQHLSFQALFVARRGVRILDDINLTASPGERVGVIGANGSGKSTMLRAIELLRHDGTAPAGFELDVGLVTVPKSTRLLAQELDDPGDAIIHTLIEQAVAPVRALEQEIEEAATMIEADHERYDRALADAEQAELWSLDARIASVLAGLGLADIPCETPVGALSGGERRRVMLAALLLERPEALLLDEPTNHLDDDAVDFLARELGRWRGPVVLASHDRWFLDAVATTIVDLDPMFGPNGPRDGVVRGRRFTGGFSDYLRERERDLRRWRDAHTAEQLERERLTHLVDVGARNIFHTTAPRGESRMARKFEADRAAKTVGGRVRQARARLAELDRAAVSAPPEPLRFRGFRAEDASSTLSGREAAYRRAEDAPLARLLDVAVAGRLAPVTLDIPRRGRILVEGPNGAGKSTLLRVLAGDLESNSGTVEWCEDLDGWRVAMLSQDDTFADLSLRGEAAYRQQLQDADAAPSLAELGLLDEAAASKPLAELSYGQRRRVALGPLVAEPADLLLLDEPTNHLALSLAEALERALVDYAGAVVIASHDRWLRQRWTGDRLQLAW